MQDALKVVVRYGQTVVRTIAAQWNHFWHHPADPNLLGILRILTGLMLVYTHAVWGIALDDFFGPKSWLSPSLVQALETGQYMYSFWFWIPPQAMWPAYAVSMLIFVAFTLGLWTRVTSVLALVTAISYVNRVPAALFGLDQINIMLTLYLAIGPSGQTLSLDRWLSVRRLGSKAKPPLPCASANLAQRLIQVHMCVIYLFAGLSKLQGPAWWDGEAMWRAFANLEYQSLDMTWLAWHPWLVNAMTHVSLVWELSFCVLIWKPLWRPVMLAGALALHLGIGLCLGMWTFGLIMLVGCASFLPNEWARDLAAWIARERNPASRGQTEASPSRRNGKPARAASPEPALRA